MRTPTASDLGRLPLFGGLSEDALRAFAEQAELLDKAAGEAVFFEGEAARTLYVLESGALEIVKRRGTAEVCLSRIRPGECFGEMSFIDMQPRSATVRATVPSGLWMWSYARIHDRYCKDSRCYTLLVMNMARELSRRLRRADDLLCAEE